MLKTTLVKTSEVIPNPNNPRVIRDDKFKRLVESIKTFPKMLELRPIVVNEQMIILGGNMRYRACIEAGMDKVPIIKAEDLTPEQQREFIIKDNVGFGEWDWDMLANEWDTEELSDWGLSFPMKVEVPTETDSSTEPKGSDSRK
jgi:ParB-like chromosome segregation protein Spo0J